MIKHIRVESFFTGGDCIKNVFLKSISGGRILDVYNFIRSRTFLQCKYFMLTVGSNDCDCGNNKAPRGETTVDLAQQIIDEYMILINYLRNFYSNPKIFVNQLIPRTRTRYSKEIFESNRIKLNSYLENLTKTDDSLVFVKHPAFENVDKLNSMLYDGVHIHPVNGVPIYVNEIKSVFIN